jgi:hypothetical protein
MKELLKTIARDVILPWALTGLAGLAAKKLAAKSPPERADKKVAGSAGEC